MTHLDTLCVELTSRCPLHCTHCSVAAGPDRSDFLSLNEFATRIVELPRLSEIYLSGGEPFEHPEFLRFVSLAKKAANRVVVYSSGTSLNESVLAPISTEQLAAAVCAGVDRIDISLYAPSATAHDSVTQTPGSFEATLTTLHRLRMLGVPFGIHYVPLADGGANIFSVFSLARAMGASRFHVLALVTQGRARSMSAQKPEAAFYEDVRELWTGDTSLRLVLSSRTRHEAGITEPTERDGLHVGMLDAAGHMYPSEGKRLPDFRSRHSIATTPIAELLTELATA
jgi:MoaA/NifB/PqqE/SkfB family radical SAM enzyme